MKIKGLEVSGIEKVVIAQKHVWERNDPEWILKNQIPQAKSCDDMVKYIHRLVSDEKNHVWVSGNTLNIVKKV